MKTNFKFLLSLLSASLLPILVVVILLKPDGYHLATLLICSLLVVLLCWRLLSESILRLTQPDDKNQAPSSQAMPEVSGKVDIVDRLILPIEKCISEFYYDKTSDENIRIQHELRRRLSTLVKRINWLPMEGESRIVTILISDLRGFTIIAEQYSAPEVMDMLNRYFSHMNEIINRFGGTVDKYIGDSIMVLFGAPISKPDDPERAVACAVEMQIAMNIFNKENQNLGLPELFMGIALNTGKVLAGQIGSHIYSDYTVMGDDVNLASRIEASALRGQILMSQKTLDHVEHLVVVKEPVGIFFKGKKDPLLLYELQAVNAPYNLKVPAREVRKCLRSAVDIPFQFQICEDKVVEPQTYEGRIMNISTGGMMIWALHSVDLFKNIKFKLGFNVIARQSGDIYGKVLRNKKKNDLYEINVEFTAINPADSSAIKDLVERTLKAAIPVAV